MVDPGMVKDQLAVFIGEKAIDIGASKDDLSNQHNSYRARILLLVREHPDKCRTEIRAMIPGVYAWLYRHDRYWLFANLPPVVRRQSVMVPRVDWDERDRKICYQIRCAAKEIKEKEPLARMSISSLGKQTGSLSLLHKHLDKLPRTREVLEMVSETIEDFQDRRIVYVIEQMKENRIKPVVWKIMRAAGLKKGAEERVNKILIRYQDVSRQKYLKK
jgi:hypothetical protein